MTILNVSGSRAPQAVDDLHAVLKHAPGETCSAWYEAGSNSFDYRRFAASAERRALARTAALLAKFPCTKLGVAKRLPFWINVCNALVVEAVAARAFAQGARLDAAFFAESKYLVAGAVVAHDPARHGTPPA